MTTVITGQGIRVYQAMTIRQGLRWWLEHGRPINRAYTPKRMLDTAAHIMGREPYAHHNKRMAMIQAVNDLTEWVDGQRAGVVERGEMREID
jgi:hypothetical protein